MVLGAILVSALLIRSMTSIIHIAVLAQHIEAFSEASNLSLSFHTARALYILSAQQTFDTLLLNTLSLSLSLGQKVPVPTRKVSDFFGSTGSDGGAAASNAGMMDTKEMCAHFKKMQFVQGAQSVTNNRRC